MKIECGFFAVNKKHCVPKGLYHCIVCRTQLEAFIGRDE